MIAFLGQCVRTKTGSTFLLLDTWKGVSDPSPDFHFFYLTVHVRKAPCWVRSTTLYSSVPHLPHLDRRPLQALSRCSEIPPPLQRPPRPSVSWYLQWTAKKKTTPATTVPSPGPSSSLRRFDNAMAAAPHFWGPWGFYYCDELHQSRNYGLRSPRISD